MKLLPTINLASRARRVVANGRAYLVAPITLIVPGVLNGTKGPLLYPPAEVSRNAAAWDGMPISVGHPQVAGMYVYFKDAGIPPIGHVRRPRFSDKLTAEGWFDEAETRRQEPRILTALEAGLPLEVSTGLLTHDEPAPPGASYLGRPYVAVARNYKPDHLAVLPDQVGACSVADGCGVFNSAACGCDRCTAARHRVAHNRKGKAMKLDVSKLADMLGVDVDPGKDPGGFVREMQKAIDELGAYFRGEAGMENRFANPRDEEEPEPLPPDSQDDPNDTEPYGPATPDAVAANRRRTAPSYSGAEGGARGGNGQGYGEVDAEDHLPVHNIDFAELVAEQRKAERRG